MSVEHFVDKEAQFKLDRTVNSQNCRTWGSSHPYVVHECSLQSDYITIWCGFVADFILDPFIIEQNISQDPRR